MARSDGDLVSIERSLGLKSDRGISRQGNKDNPVIQDLLSDIKSIAEQYVSKPNTEIRSSPTLEQASLDLFSRYGPILWPGPGCERPNWLESPSLERYDGRYPKELHYSDAGDRQLLAELFHDLVVEKCVKYHDNQLQKARRIARRSEMDPADQEHEDHFVHSQPPAAHIHSAESADQLGKANHIGLSSVSLRVPHGLPFTESAIKDPEDDDDDATTPEDGPNSRTKTQRLQDYRNEMARMDESFVLAPTDLSRAGVKRRQIHDLESTPKRVRGESDQETTSLDVPPQNNSDPLQHAPEDQANGASKLPNDAEQQATDATAAASPHSPSKPSNGHDHAEGTQAEGTTANGVEEKTTTTATASPLHRDSFAPPASDKSPPPRRSSGFQAINASGDNALDKVSSVVQQSSNTATESPDASQRTQSDPMQGYRKSLPPLSAQQNPLVNNATFTLLPHEKSPPSPLTVVPVSQPRQDLSIERRPGILDRPQPKGPTEWSQQGPVRHTMPIDGTRPPIAASPAPGAVSPRTVPQPHNSMNGPPARTLSSQRPHHLPSSPATHPYHFSPQTHNHSHPSAQPQSYPQRPPSHPGQRTFATRTVSSPYGSPHAPHGRHQSLADEILGDLAKTPVVAQLMAANTDLDAQQLRNLKDKLTKFPEARVDINILLARMSAPMDPPKTSSPHFIPPPTSAPPAPAGWRPGPTGPPPIQNPMPRPAQSHMGLNGSVYSSRPPPPKPQPLSYPPLPGNTLPNVSVELNWGRQLDFSDFMEMRDCDTTKEFFALIDAHVPDELLRLGKPIKEVRVKALKDLHGGNLLPRIVRDESRGRAAIRQLVKKLKAQPPGSEAELMFMVVWEDGR